jgi:hypothetical protein
MADTTTIDIPLEDPGLLVQIHLTQVEKTTTEDGYSFSFVPVFRGAKLDEIKKVWLIFTASASDHQGGALWSDNASPRTSSLLMTESVSVEGGVKLALNGGANVGASASKSNTSGNMTILLRMTNSQLQWKYRLHKTKGDAVGTGQVVVGLKHSCTLSKTALTVHVRANVESRDFGDFVGTVVFFSHGHGKKVLIGASATLILENQHSSI